MKIPQSFKDKMKSTFYDKEVTLYSSEVVKESDGWTRKKELAVTGTFLGNVRFDNLKQIQEDYGIKDQIDLSITTDSNVSRDQIIGYDGRVFKIIESKKFDSHNLLIAQIWSSKLTTSISA